MTSNHRILEETDIALIKRVKLTPALYDPRNSEFRVAFRKEQEWNNVAASLGMTGTDARRRWTCLRDRYTRELKQLLLYPDKGEYGKNDFFRLMDFLRRFVRKRRKRTRSSLKCESWEGSMDETTLAGNQTKFDTDDADCVIAEEGQNFESNTNQLELRDTMETEVAVEYPEFVEVDSSSVYDEKSPPQTSCKTLKSEENSILLATQSCGGSGTFTISTPAMILQQQQQHKLQQQPLQHVQTHEFNESHLQQQTQHQQQESLRKQILHRPVEVGNETEDDFFCKSIAVYLRQLSRRHKIKAKVEMFQILEKYIEIEDDIMCRNNCCGLGHHHTKPKGSL